MSVFLYVAVLVGRRVCVQGAFSKKLPSFFHKTIVAIFKRGLIVDLLSDQAARHETSCISSEICRNRLFPWRPWGHMHTWAMIHKNDEFCRLSGVNPSHTRLSIKLTASWDLLYILRSDLKIFCCERCRASLLSVFKEVSSLCCVNVVLIKQKCRTRCEDVRILWNQEGWPKRWAMQWSK